VTDSADAQRELIVTYLLGELDREAAADLEQRLEADPELRAELESLRSVAAELKRLPAAAWAEVDPPPFAIGDLADRREPATARVHERRHWRSRWNRPQLAVAGLAAVAALGVGVALGFALDDDSVSKPAGTPVELRAIGSAAPAARGELTVGPGDHADLRVSDLPANGRDYYEIWLLGDDGLVPLGSFKVGDDGAADIPLTLPVDPAGYQSFDVSREPDDGNPGHSGDSILRGPA